MTKTLGGPELSATFESTLALAAGGLDGAAADRPAKIGDLLVIHSSALVGEIVLLFAHHLFGFTGWFVQSGDCFQRDLFLAMTQLVHAFFRPRLGQCLPVAISLSQLAEMFTAVKEIQQLPRFRP